MDNDIGVLHVLHAARLIGFAPSERLIGRAGVAEADSELLLSKIADAGWMRYRSGASAGWLLTSEGRAHHEQLLADELESNGSRSVVETGYAEFRVLNPVLLRVCSEWQLLPGEVRVLNDHSDREYDDSVVRQLAELDAAIEPILHRLTESLSRFGSYRVRLAHALERVANGENDWFTRPMIDSYHTVWFELHEDLLATLGIDRSSESSYGLDAP